ncbi:MAG: PfkB family carbohydrate kinase [Planctomycetota bacterium]|nr:PfkB family carbohydrate kinase [Planctomycetota bacterium]MDA1262778.1 PfkB family carbohydrate kinase [Planctomycetota bacterium]
MKLVVTGTIGIDTVQTPRAKREGVLGGSAAYFAAAASQLCPVRLVAVVGGDWPAEHHSILKSFSGVCLDGLESRTNSRTFAWGGKYFEDVNRRETLFTEVGVLQEEPPRVPAAYADSEIVFLGNTHPAVQLGFVDQFPNRKLVVADTMDLWIRTAHPELSTLLQRVDGLIVNDSEAAELTGVRNAISAGRKILEMGPKFVVVKKGEHGAILVHPEGTAVIPAFPIDESYVVDPTGAGDSFAGGFMGYLAREGRFDFASLQKAMAYGTVIASFSLEAFGLDRMRSLKPEEIIKRLGQFQQMARVG